MIGVALTLALAAGPVLTPEMQQASAVLREHMKAGVPETRVGNWVTYQFTGGSDRVHFMRLAVVGEEVDEKGRPAWWMELEMGTHAELRAPMSQMRLLVAKEEGVTQSGITRAIVSWGTTKPQELDKDALAMLFKQEAAEPRAEPEPVNKKVELKTHTGKSTRLVTLAGTIEAVPIELRLRETVVKRMWLSRQVPLLQLARIELPAADNTMEVRGFGLDAKPRVLMPVKGSPLVGVTHFDDESKVPGIAEDQEDFHAPVPQPQGP